jgi:hypothetical protein
LHVKRDARFLPVGEGRVCSVGQTKSARWFPTPVQKKELRRKARASENGAIMAQIRRNTNRMAEIANILITTGIILIIPAVEITAADLTLFQTILDPTRIVTIWVGTNTSMDLSYEINLVESASIEESVPPIVQRLQDGGFIVENS